MGYMHIDNLYKDQTILLFKECYALEKIHGSSAHISWDHINQKINYFAGGEKHETFIKIFDHEFLLEQFKEKFPLSDIVVFGEVYGGKCQGMSHTYGKQLRFIAFDIKVDDLWLNVPSAEQIVLDLNLEFVYYEKVSTDLLELNNQRDLPSVQAIRNGIVEESKKREGVVLRPLIELRTNNGSRVICKHKGEDFQETKTKREVVNPDKYKVLENAKLIAEEWVTEMRLLHVLDKIPQDTGIEHTKDVILAMIEDVYREGRDEIVESKEVTKAIGSKTAQMFKKKLEKI